MIFAVVLIIPYLLAAGYFLSKINWANALSLKRAEYSSEGGRPCNPGPWGDLEYIPIAIETPEEFLSIQAFEATDNRWFFGGMTRKLRSFWGNRGWGLRYRGACVLCAPTGVA